MGMFDTIRATLTCQDCGVTAEREIQTKQGPCVLLNLEIGDTIEPFFYGEYWLEERKSWMFMISFSRFSGRIEEDSRKVL